MAIKTFDTKCYDLAAHFLSDIPLNSTEREKRALAIAIQQTVEDYCSDLEQRLSDQKAMGNGLSVVHEDGTIFDPGRV